jgi:hypothetical protein
MLARSLPTVLLAAALAGCTLEDTAKLPGDVNRFDPIAAVPAVVAFAGAGARLVSLESHFVREDGTQDLEASYIGYAQPNTYELVRPNSKKADSTAPVGAHPRAAAYEGVDVRIMKPHWVSQSVNGRSPQEKKHQGMEIGPGGSSDPKLAVPAPACGFAKLWAAALHHGAPKGAVAVIRYDAKGYALKIDGTAVDLHFDRACNVAPAPRP